MKIKKNKLKPSSGPQALNKHSFYLTGLILLLVSFGAFSQNLNITGKITDSKNGEPLAYASISLSNSSYGTQSDENGNYKLVNIKAGQYELIVRYLGYETYRQILKPNEKSQQLSIKLVPKMNELNEVVVRPDLHRERNLGIFKREFIGNSDAALKFKMLNPEVLTISYEEGKLLEASSYDFLIFENKHLGYRIKYILHEFTKTYIPDSFGAGMMYYEGASLFEELKGRTAQIKRWKKNRLNTYLGSQTHFYRSILRNQTQSQGFAMYPLIKKENADRPSDEIIEKKLERFRAFSGSSDKTKRDSLEYWINKKNLPKQIQLLFKDSVQTKDIFRLTNQKELSAILFPNFLYVTYKESGPVKQATSMYKPFDIVNVEGSTINLTGKYAIFDQNGIVVNARDVLYEGAWAIPKAPQMLPSDYQPGE